MGSMSKWDGTGVDAAAAAPAPSMVAGNHGATMQTLVESREGTSVASASHSMKHDSTHSTANLDAQAISKKRSGPWYFAALPVYQATDKRHRASEDGHSNVEIFPSNKSVVLLGGTTTNEDPLSSGNAIFQFHMECFRHNFGALSANEQKNCLRYFVDMFAFQHISDSGDDVRTLDDGAAGDFVRQALSDNGFPTTMAGLQVPNITGAGSVFNTNTATRNETSNAAWSTSYGQFDDVDEDGPLAGFQLEQREQRPEQLHVDILQRLGSENAPGATTGQYSNEVNVAPDQHGLQGNHAPDDDDEDSEALDMTEAQEQLAELVEYAAGRGASPRKDGLFRGTKRISKNVSAYCDFLPTKQVAQAFFSLVDKRLQKMQPDELTNLDDEAARQMSAEVEIEVRHLYFRSIGA